MAKRTKDRAMETAFLEEVTVTQAKAPKWRMRARTAWRGRRNNIIKTNKQKNTDIRVLTKKISRKMGYFFLSGLSKTI